MREQHGQFAFEFGAYRMEAEERLLTRNGQVIHLPPKAVDLLFALLESGGRVLTKDELMRRVWADSFVEETNLTHNISLLRRVLGEKRDGEKFIETIPRRGYRFVAPVVQLQVSDLEVIARERSVTQVVIDEELEFDDAEKDEISGKDVGYAQRRLRSRPATTGVIISVLVAAMVLGLGGYAWRESNKNSASLFQQRSLKRLTNNGEVVWATLSVDGKLFAYSVRDKAGRESLWLGRVDGSREIELRPPAEKLYRGFSFSPDGGTFYYSEADDESRTMYKIPVLGGVPEKIKERAPGHIAYSPAHDRFAFVRHNADRGSALVVSDINGTDEREVAARPRNLSFISSTVAWSPDGNSIAVAAINHEDSERKEVFVISLVDGAIAQLTRNAWKEIRSIAWFKDSNALVVAAAEKGSLWFATQLWQVSYPEGSVQRITSDLNIYGSILATSADNDSILTVTGQQLSNIWVAPVENLAARRQITFDSIGRASGWNGLGWLPDGKIVYTALVDNYVSIWTMDANGENQRQLTPPGFTDRLPTAPANGNFIVFESDRGGSFDIWRMDPEGGNLQQLTFGAKTDQPHVSPDGKWVAYIGSHDGRRGLWRIPAEGGDPFFLNENAIVSPRFSPDSKLVAVGYSDNGKARLAVISAENGETVEIFDVRRLAYLSASLKWTPDGRAVSYRDAVNGLWIQKLDGAAPERLEDLPIEKLYGYDWSHDGKFLAFTLGTENRDVVLIDSSDK